MRRNWENVRDKDEERAEQELEWGRGEMEKEEDGEDGRWANNEWELAIRGWQE